MTDAFDDEAEQTVSIQEYLKGVEEQELVCFFLVHNLVYCFVYSCIALLLFSFGCHINDEKIYYYTRITK